MKAGRQPVQQALLGAVQVHIGNGDLGESQLTRPPTQLHQQLLLVEVNLPGHEPILETRTLHWPDEAACESFARALATRPGLHNAYIELHGPLGAGKTTFVRHLLRALGVQGRIKSPTYAVLEPYELPGLNVSHLDFYRFTDPRELIDAGFRDVMAAPGLKLAEWPEHAAGLLPVADLRMFIEPGDGDERQVSIQACTVAGLSLLPP
jgi:tRNA threonylcarbamoyladenosine biosynthesis protein TsaE